MGFAVYHGAKGKGSGGGIGNHIDRKEGMKHTYPHADPERFHLNKNLIPNNAYSKMKLPDAIRERIEQGYTGKKKLRNDSVKFISHVLTGSHKDMKAIFENQEKRQAWVQKNYDFISKEFGEKNIVRFMIHMDEKTPHIHAVTVPITEDGRLSAKEIYGNKEALVSRQDRYAEQMKEFGLERGIRGTGIKHEDAKAYYGRIEKAQKEVDNTIQPPSKNLIGAYKENSVLEMQNALKSANLALKDVSAKLEKEQGKSKAAVLQKSAAEEKTNQRYREVISLKEDNKALAKQEQDLVSNYNHLILNPDSDIAKGYREKLIEREKFNKEIERIKDRNRGRSM